MFDDLPLIDGHAHPIFGGPTAAAATRESFARYFTEAHDAETVSRHAPHTLFYRHALRELAALLGCEPTEAAVIAARAVQPLEVYLRRLLAAARVEAVLLDDGYPREGALSVGELAQAGGVRAARVLRLERLIERLVPQHDSLATLQEAVLGALEAARQEGAPAEPGGAGVPRLAALKSIVAYRSGLAIGPPDPGAAEAARAAVRAAGGGRPDRLAAKPLLDHFIGVAAEWAAARGLPLQLHTGFGDRDLDLRLANPLHLRPRLEDGSLARGPVVLLHAGYPYVREAAYLASVYPNVYVDISQAAPLVAGPGLTRAMEDLFALAPVTKVLYGSDAWGIPEWFWLAARAARHALVEALSWLPEAEARWAARRVLHDNAAELYRTGA